MAHYGDFTPGFVQNLQTIEQQGQLDKLSLVLAMVGAARAVARLGRPAAEAVFRQMAGNSDVNVEDIFAQVDWH